MDIKEMDYETDETGTGSCSLEGFGITDVETLGSIIKKGIVEVGWLLIHLQPFKLTHFCFHFMN
jgi:hypothetical protein